MKFSELLKLSNLDGFRIKEGYWVELRHGLMGTLPALISATNEPFFCLSRDNIEKALSYLPSKGYKINKTLLLVNEEKRIAFDLSAVFGFLEFGREVESHSVFSNLDVGILRDGDLKWAPKPVGHDTTIEDEESEDTLHTAMIEAGEG